MKYQAYPEYKDSGVEWLGVVPTHWNLTRIKYIAELTPKKPNVQRNLQCSFVPMEKLKTNSIVLDEERLIDDVYDGYTYFKNEDILMAKVTPCFENKNIAVAKELVNQIGFGSTEIFVLRINEKASNKYLYYRLQEDSFMDIATAAMTGAGGLKRVPSEVVNNFTAAFPFVDEQEVIANFLDHETAKIDTLIEKQQQLIKLLKEKRQAVISHAVTKGLNPNAPMRDSGVEWLSEVPEHWEIKQAKHVFILQRGHDLSSDKFIEGKYPVFGSNGSIGYHNKYTTNAPSLTVGRSGSVGEVNYIEENFWAHNTSLYLKEAKNAEVKFIYYMILAMNVKSLSAGSAVGTLDRNNIHAMYVIHPNIDEQRKIVIYLDKKLQQFEDITNKANSAIELMQERRTALISAAVTGKIDVRHWNGVSA
jgi:type I restriction enzyme S subunit